jgi:hypothetical protein
MPWVGLEPTIPVFERATAVHVLDRATTVMASYRSENLKSSFCGDTLWIYFQILWKNVFVLILINMENDVVYNKVGIVRINGNFESKFITKFPS